MIFELYAVYSVIKFEQKVCRKEFLNSVEFSVLIRIYPQKVQKTQQTV